MALKSDIEVLKNLKCTRCGKEVESLAFPDEKYIVCMDCIDGYMREAEAHFDKYPPRDEKE